MIASVKNSAIVGEESATGDCMADLLSTNQLIRANSPPDRPAMLYSKEEKESRHTPSWPNSTPHKVTKYRLISILTCRSSGDGHPRKEVRVKNVIPMISYSSHTGPASAIKPLPGLLQKQETKHQPRRPWLVQRKKTFTFSTLCKGKRR